MCGVSESEDQKTSLYLGYYGGGELEYGQYKYKQGNEGQRLLMSCQLHKLSKTDLVKMILDFVENGEEG